MDTPVGILRPQFENYGVEAPFTGPCATTTCSVAWAELLSSLFGLPFPCTLGYIKLDYLRVLPALKFSNSVNPITT